VQRPNRGVLRLTLNPSYSFSRDERRVVGHQQVRSYSAFVEVSIVRTQDVRTQEKACSSDSRFKMQTEWDDRTLSSGNAETADVVCGSMGLVLSIYRVCGHIRIRERPVWFRVGCV